LQFEQLDGEVVGAGPGGGAGRAGVEECHQLWPSAGIGPLMMVSQISRVVPAQNSACE